MGSFSSLWPAETACGRSSGACRLPRSPRLPGGQLPSEADFMRSGLASNFSWTQTSRVKLPNHEHQRPTTPHMRPPETVGSGTREGYHLLRRPSRAHARLCSPPTRPGPRFGQLPRGTTPRDFREPQPARSACSYDGGLPGPVGIGASGQPAQGRIDCARLSTISGALSAVMARRHPYNTDSSELLEPAFRSLGATTQIPRECPAGARRATAQHGSPNCRPGCEAV